LYTTVQAIDQFVPTAETGTSSAPSVSVQGMAATGVSVNVTASPDASVIATDTLSGVTASPSDSSV
jgi:hypothetical protein